MTLVDWPSPQDPPSGPFPIPELFPLILSPLKLTKGKVGAQRQLSPSSREKLAPVAEGATSFLEKANSGAMLCLPDDLCAPSCSLCPIPGLPSKVQGFCYGILVVAGGRLRSHTLCVSEGWELGLELREGERKKVGREAESRDG